MRPKLHVLVAGALALVVLGACGSSSNKSSTKEPATTVAPQASSATTVAAEATTVPAAATGAVVVAKGTTSLGDTLVDKDGMTLYQFENDKDGTIACTAGCTTIWPPVVVTTDPPNAGPGISADAKFATVTRDDGTKQLTVNGHPLYRFSADKATGDINGQKIGNVWYVTGIKGEKLGDNS